MLDQNTDRMWYVIGAVLIGAAIIFGANSLYPSAFASVTGLMSDLTSEAGSSFGVNLFNMETANKGVVLSMNGEYFETPTHSLSDLIRVEPGETYVFKTEGTSHNKRITYHYQNGDYIPDSGVLLRDNHYELRSTVPMDAYYARISTNHLPSGHRAAPLTEWWFGLEKNVNLW